LLRVIICSDRDLTAELRSTVVGRGGIDRFQCTEMEEIRRLSAAISPQAILVDRDLPEARSLIEELRQEPSTRERSIAVLARGAVRPLEAELIASGANAVLRLPPDRQWDSRLSRLLDIASRQDTRLEVQFAVDARSGAEDADGDSSAQALNISPTGMRLQTTLRLVIGQEIVFRFELPGSEEIAGRGRVTREASTKVFGIEFVNLDSASQQAIRNYVRAIRLEQETAR
jgi:DNA-binding response OmpR family regulator